MWRGAENGTPKTAASIRIVNLHPLLQNMLIEFTCGLPDGFLFRSRTGTPLGEKTIRNHVPFGLHCCRRFRTGVLRRAHVHADILRMFLGHSAASQTDEYSRLADDIELRKSECRKAGLGFRLPDRLGNRGIKARPSSTEIESTAVTATETATETASVTLCD